MNDDVDFGSDGRQLFAFVLLCGQHTLRTTTEIEKEIFAMNQRHAPFNSFALFE